MVYLELSGGLPHNVWWERFNSPDVAASAGMVVKGRMRHWQSSNLEFVYEVVLCIPLQYVRLCNGVFVLMAVCM